jgi:hypothetical protein
MTTGTAAEIPSEPMQVIFLITLHTQKNVKQTHKKEKMMNTKTLVTRTTVTFVTLAIAGILMAVGAKTISEPVDQTILIAIGSAVFGAALTFLLVRIFSLVEK